MTSDASETTSEALEALEARLARLIVRMDEVQATMIRELTSLRAEADGILTEIRTSMPETRRTGNEVGRRLPVVPIPDERLRTVWLVLSRYPEGTTADVVAHDLDRHRTTISTYLNTLVLMGFAEKKRRGHEILYTAIVNTDRAES